MTDQVTRRKFVYDERKRLHESNPNAKKRVLPMHVIRELNRAQRGEPSFVCANPKCRQRYGMGFAVFGRVRWGQEAQFYCKDCADSIEGFTRVK